MPGAGGVGDTPLPPGDEKPPLPPEPPPAEEEKKPKEVRVKPSCQHAACQFTQYTAYSMQENLSNILRTLRYASKSPSF